MAASGGERAGQSEGERRTPAWAEWSDPRGPSVPGLDYWQASQTSGLVGAGALGFGVKLVSLDTVAWRMRVAGRERR